MTAEPQFIKVDQPTPAKKVNGQSLFRHQSLSILLCRRCNDSDHRFCERSACECPCKDPKPQQKARGKALARGPDGLTDEQRRLSGSLDFAAIGSFQVGPEKKEGE
jgi:hypothetical protein